MAETPTQEPVATEESAATEATQTESEALDLDSVLSEYESKESSAPAEPTTETPQQPAPIDPKYEAFMNEVIQERAQRSVEQATDMLLESAGIEVDRDLALGYLQVRAARDPRLVQAYQNMNTNPDGFKKVMKALAPEFKEKFKQPDAKKTADSQAARAAVKGQDTQIPEKSDAPSRADLANMSDAELDAHKRSLLQRG